jgi:hypothetical protein
MIISVTGSSCLRLHLLLELMNHGGGSVSSRLVSEEDIELKFTCPITEDLVVQDAGGEFNLIAGDTLVATWKLHVNGDEPMASEHAVRFGTKGQRA